MSLQMVREMFITATGREDLREPFASGIHASARADFFINAGQRYLDRVVDTVKSRTSWRVRLSAGAFCTLVPQCIALFECSIITEGSKRVKLQQVTVDELLDIYSGTIEAADSELAPPVKFTTTNSGIVNPDSLVNGHWAVYDAAAAPGQNPILGQPSQPYVDGLNGAILGDHYEFHGVVFMPPLAEASTVEVHGRFFSPWLEADGAKSYWTEVAPNVLVMAAARQLEVTMRNSEGVRDWDAALASELQALAFSDVEQLTYGIYQIEG